MDKSLTTPSTTVASSKPLPSRSPASINHNSSKKKQQRLDDIFATRQVGSRPSNATSPPAQPPLHSTVAPSKTEVQAGEDDTPSPASSYFHARPEHKQLQDKVDYFVQHCAPHHNPYHHGLNASSSSNGPPTVALISANGNGGVTHPPSGGVQLTEEMAVESYQTIIIGYYEFASKQESNKLSIASTRQPPRNAAQKAVYNDFLDFTFGILEFLLKKNVVLDPGSPAIADIIHENHTIDNCNSHIYWIIELLKAGLTGDGKERLLEYINKYGVGIVSQIISCIDFDNIPVDIQQEVVVLVIKGLEKFLPAKLPTTVYEALLVEMFGLPIATVHYFWSVVKTTEECPIIGGAIHIQSFLRRLLLCIFESGLREHMYRRDPSSVDSSSVNNEFANSNLLGYYITWDLFQKKDADKLFSLLSPPTREVVKKRSIPVEEKSTWAPGSINDTCTRGATPCILDNIVGPENWSNSIPLTPLDILKQDENILQEAVSFGCQKCIQESANHGVASSLEHKDKCPRKPTARLCFASYLYKPVHQRSMLGEKDVSLNKVVRIGGYILLDEDLVAVGVLGGKDLVQYVLDSKPILPDGTVGRWRPYHKFLRAHVLTLDYEGDDNVRFAIIHVRTCDMVNTDPNVKWDNDTVGGMSLSAITLQWAQEVCAQASGENTSLITNKSIHRPLNKLLFGWVLSAGYSLSSHVSPKASCHYFKNYVDGDSINLNADGNTGLKKKELVGDVNGHVFGSNARRELSRESRKRSAAGELKVDEAETTTNDKKVYLRAMCCITRGEYVEAADILRSGVSANSASARYKTFTTKWLCQGSKTLSNFVQAHNLGRCNSGNTDSHNSSSSETMDMVTRQLAPWIANGRKFFVQAEGSASVDGQTWPGSTRPFTFPVDGTIIKSEPRSGKPSVVFRSSDVVTGIGFRGLMGRAQRGTNGNGNTKTKKIDRDQLKGYELRHTPGIMHYSATTFHHINEHNVAEVHFVKKSEVTTTQSGRKRKTTDEEVKVQYEEEFESAVAVLKSKGIDSNKLQKGEVVVLLWCGFGVGQSSSSPYRKDTKKKKATELKDMLKERIAANASWIKDTRQKLNAKKAIKTEE